MALAAPVRRDDEVVYPEPGFSPLGGLRVGSDGKTSYRFEGGIEILASDDNPDGDPEHKLTWVRQSDGAAVAELHGYESPGPPPAGVLTAYARNPSGSTFNNAGLTVVSRETPDLSSVQAVISQLYSRTLIDTNGRSSFLQIGDTVPRAVAVVAGVVNADGSIRQALTHGWTSSRVGLGNYVVTLDTAFVSEPAWFATGTIGTEARAVVPGVGAAQFNFFGSGGAALDNIFSFAVIGLRA